MRPQALIAGAIIACSASYAFAGGAIGISIGTMAGQARDAAAAILAENARLSIANNLSDLAAPATARANLGLGTAATSAASAFDAAGAASAVAATLNARAPAASTVLTPSLLIGGAAPSAATYTVQVLRGVVIGPVLEFTLDIEWTGLANGAGAITVMGLPFGAVATGEYSVSGFGITTSSAPYVTVNAAGTMLFFLSSNTTAPNADAPMLGTALSASGGLIVTGRYFIN